MIINHHLIHTLLARKEVQVNRIWIDDGMPTIPEFSARFNLTMDQYFDRGKNEFRPGRVVNHDVGNLVMLGTKDLTCYYAGIISTNHDDDMSRGFTVHLWALPEPMYVPLEMPGHTAMHASGRFYDHAIVTIGSQRKTAGVVKLDASNADALKVKVGPYVTQELREVFWSEGERLLIEANAKAEAEFVEKANALLDRLTY